MANIEHKKHQHQHQNNDNNDLSGLQVSNQYSINTSRTPPPYPPPPPPPLETAYSLPSGHKQESKKAKEETKKQVWSLTHVQGLPEAQIRRPEVVRPLGHAVSLVHAEEGYGGQGSGGARQPAEGRGA